MISDLNDFFNSSVILNKHVNRNNKLTVMMTENGHGASVKKLFVHNVPAESLVLSLDVCTTKMDSDEKIKFSRLNHYFRDGNKKGINKRCDMVIFCRDETDESHINIIIFDLKSSDPDFKSTIDQLKNSEIFIKYVLSLVEQFYTKTARVSFHRVIGDTRRRKLPTRINNSELLEKMKKIREILFANEVKEIELMPDGKNRAKLNFNDLLCN